MTSLLNFKFVFAIISVAFGSGFQHGYNTGVINNPHKLITEWMSDLYKERYRKKIENWLLTLLWSSIVSAFCVGGMFGGGISGFIANVIGRRTGLFWNNILAITGSLLEGISYEVKSYEILIIGRLIMGINAGINAGIACMYLTEISPVAIRGSIATVYQLAITISILFSQIFSLEEVLGTRNRWFWLFVLPIIPSILQMITLVFCPESPKYLLSNKFDDTKAAKALDWLRGGKNEDKEEITQIKTECELARIAPKIYPKSYFTETHLRKPFIISIMLMIAQQCSGINAVMFYSTNIFVMSGISATNATYATLAMGAINVLTTIISMIIIDIAGRVKLLLIGFGGMTISLAFLIPTTIYGEIYVFCSVFSIILVQIYVVTFAVGVGPIPWFLVSELFNQSARPFANSIAVLTNWLFNAIVGLLFLPLKESIGPYVFLIFLCINAAFFVYVIIFVPETKNKTIDEIQATFK